MKTVLITGGAGYIGSHLTKIFLDQGYRVRVLEAFYYGRSGMKDWIKHPHVEVIQGDICNIKDMVRATKGVDTILALAAIVGDPACELDRDDTLSVNFESTKLLVEIAKWHKVRRIVFASSCSVYGSNSAIILNEGSWLNPVSLYAETRIMSEKVLLEALRDQIEIVILRLGTVFGFSERMRFDLVVNTMVAKAFFEGQITVNGASQYRPLVHCRDVARAFFLASEKAPQYVNGQIFNVGSNDQNFTIGQIGELVAKQFPGVKLTVTDSADRRDYRVDFSKIRNILDFEIQTPLEKGIREIASYLEKNPNLNAGDDVFYNVKYLYKLNEKRAQSQGAH